MNMYFIYCITKYYKTTWFRNTGI